MARQKPRLGTWGAMAPIMPRPTQDHMIGHMTDICKYVLFTFEDSRALLNELLSTGPDTPKDQARQGIERMHAAAGRCFELAEQHACGPDLRDICLSCRVLTAQGAAWGALTLLWRGDYGDMSCMMEKAVGALCSVTEELYKAKLG